MREFQFWDVLQDTRPEISQHEVTSLLPRQTEFEPSINQFEPLESINHMPPKELGDNNEKEFQVYSQEKETY